MSVTTSVRGLVPPRPLVRRRSRETAGAADSGRVVFSLVAAAVVVQLTLSPNVLQAAGIPYDTPGGIPLEKFHPGTYLAAAAVMLQLSRERPVAARLGERVAAAPHFPLAIGLMLLTAIYAFFSTGMSGSAVYIESYAAAGLLGMALERLPPRRLRLLTRVMIAAFVANALLCVFETARQRLLVPIWVTDTGGFATELPMLAQEFRGVALYDNPLGGAIMSMIGVLLCLASDLRPVLKWAAVAILMVSLVAFGGRTAMLVTYATVAGLAALALISRLVTRTLSSAGLAVALAVLVVAPAVLSVVLFATPLGARISGKFYVDNSAAVRVVQWLILDQMDARAWLFGMDLDRLLTMMRQIGLEPPQNDIENFWLLVFVSLGGVGFTIWLTGFGLILRRLWIVPGVYGRLILLSTLVVASGANSLGRKSNTLFICVAAVMSAAAFARHPDPAETP